MIIKTMDIMNYKELLKGFVKKCIYFNGTYNLFIINYMHKSGLIQNSESYPEQLFKMNFDFNKTIAT